MGSCPEEEYKINGKKKRRKIGKESYYFGRMTFQKFEGSKLCMIRDPLGRNYYSIMEEPMYRAGGL